MHITNLPDRVEDIGHLVFFFKTKIHENFLQTLTEFKKRNEKLKITAISPLWTIQGNGVYMVVEGYCVNCEEA